MANEKKIIDKLTPEQKAKIEDYYKLGLDIGLKAAPSSRAEVEELTLKLYDEHKLGKPRFEWAESPLAGFKRAEELDPQSGWATVSYGQHNAGFLVWAMYCREVLSLTEETDEVVTLYEIAKRTSWYWCWDELVIHSERPKWVLTDERGNLHSVEKRAIEYPDKWGFSAVHGVYVPDWLIEKHHEKTLTVADVKSLSNAEQNRVAMELYGYERWVIDAEAELVHTDDFGKLYRMPGGDVVVIVEDAYQHADGSRNKYALRVDPQLRPLLPDQQFGEPQILTARNAVASTFGMRGEEYDPKVER